MAFDILNPHATATISFEGLAVLCFNQHFNNDQGRWEIAIPRFNDHFLTIKIPGLFNLQVDRTVKLIEIKDREGVPTKPTHEIGATFNRKERASNDPNDFRWVRDFTDNTELPHTNVQPITKAENPNRVDVTMLYVYDAVFYTKNIEPEVVKMIRANQEDTVPVTGNALTPAVPGAPSLLDQLEDLGSEAKVLGIDVQSPRGGAVDIIFDSVIATTIPQGNTPREILIRNLEDAEITDDERFIITAKSQFRLGDFFRYYQLFKVDGPVSHMWGKVAAGDSSNSDCCCNQIKVRMSNLDAFLQ